MYPMARRKNDQCWHMTDKDGEKGKERKKKTEILGKITKLRLAVVSTHFTAMPFFKKYYNTFQLTF